MNFFAALELYTLLNADPNYCDGYLYSVTAGRHLVCFTRVSDSAKITCDGETVTVVPK
jgi:hypothetical protein